MTMHSNIYIVDTVVDAPAQTPVISKADKLKSLLTYTDKPAESYRSKGQKLIFYHIISSQIVNILFGLIAC